MWQMNASVSMQKMHDPPPTSRVLSGSYDPGWHTSFAGQAHVRPPSRETEGVLSMQDKLKWHGW